MKRRCAFCPKRATHLDTYDDVAFCSYHLVWYYFGLTGPVCHD